jgi:hypothetical protein
MGRRDHSSRRAATDGYRTPGAADDLDAERLAAWQQAVEQAYQDALSEFQPQDGSPPAERAGQYVSPRPIQGREIPLTWQPVPRQLVGCLGRRRARAICDADEVPGLDPKAAKDTLAGGREWHNEYCEYKVIRRHDDKTGRLRPKRVEITTELREYWVFLARECPESLLSLAREVLENEKVTYDDLYGQNPVELTPEKRQEAFVRVSAGSDVRDPRVAPRGPCNRDRALFMCHPINGLDDLYFISLFGAQPCARRQDGELLPVPLMRLFLDNPWFRASADDVRQLRDTYCRNADPSAAAVAYAAAFAGARVALADPPGVYLREEDFDLTALRYRSEPVDERWVRWRRPETGTRHQRLEVGPRDEDDAFLDDIDVCRGSTAVPLTGGFQLLELLSVGPQVVAEPLAAPSPQDFYLIEGGGGEVRCGSRTSDVCQQLAAWAKAIDAPDASSRLAVPRWRRRKLRSTRDDEASHS